MHRFELMHPLRNGSSLPSRTSRAPSPAKVMHNDRTAVDVTPRQLSSPRRVQATTLPFTTTLSGRASARTSARGSVP